jgi:hypothetical protein
VVLAFLRSEIDSPRFRTIALSALAGDTSLIERASLDDRAENDARREALAAYRGYGRGTFLFGGFPAHIEWVRLALTRPDVGELLYANYRAWTRLSGGSRRVRDGAANLGKVSLDEYQLDPTPHIRATESEIRRGRSLAEMIVVAEGPNRRHVLLEGHTRATAYALALEDDAEVQTLAGYSPQISGWVWY